MKLSVVLVCFILAGDNYLYTEPVETPSNPESKEELCVYILGEDIFFNIPCPEEGPQPPRTTVLCAYNLPGYDVNPNCYMYTIRFSYFRS